MWNLLQQWYQRRFSDPQAISLLAILLVIFGILYFFNELLTPLLVALVVAYLLEWPTSRLERWGCSRTIAASIILSIFAAIVLVIGLVIVPLAWQQGLHLFSDLPGMLTRLYQQALHLPERFPTLVNVGLVDIIIENLRSRVNDMGEQVLRYSLASLVGLMTVAIYLVLVPLMVFFLLKDKEKLVAGIAKRLPRHHMLAGEVWLEMNQQVSNYIRGKAIEMLVVGVVSWLAFLALGMNYALLLGVLVGVSVLVPYVGAFVVTIPVIGVGLAQWGVTGDFWLMFTVYVVIQALDGNILVPVLFAEAVNLPPLAIILSVLIFGGLWGFWGVFFAIPLATLIKAVVQLWPGDDDAERENSH
ncbi:MAG: Putative transport protein YhhT [Candidatus Erwinia impunctatus]|nr:Putative transport protein YhhT [Culicoides impunctatus]